MARQLLLSDRGNAILQKEMAMNTQRIKFKYYDAAVALLMLGLILGVYLKSSAL